MRIISKGGVWKNVEDEILKASVMKYGKNQWARISSLLVGKSAKQCKARWYEWLDPSIKKTEWSREEDEKLLHCAKIFPNQWKTIAPIVGRTSAQCLQRYEQLLDAVQSKEVLDPQDDPRRLRPGEIDPAPETKPPRPDPIDMDEAEKEMLSEARARLANTKGKKAKRKAREKQLEEARRLATLQKKREMKLAGIPAPKQVGKKKKTGIDYNKEIPFLRRPAPGFYEVDYDAEDSRAKEELSSIPMETMDGKRRAEEEQENRKKDAKKMKTKEKTSLPDAIMQINKLNDPANIQNKLKLNLPAPQVTDEMLEEIAKSDAQMTDLTNQLDSDTAATKSLLPSFSPAPSSTPAFGGRGATASRFGLPASKTPMRTPGRTPAREDNIMKEVQNLIALSTQQTPLIGGENPTLHPSDFSGATPKPQMAKTPNPMASNVTPGRGRSGQTPVRDFLNINDDSQLEEQHKQKVMKSQLRSQLKGLPAPQNEYNVVLPDETPSVEDEITEEQEVDMADHESHVQKQRKAVENEKMRRRSSVLQRNLPRPVSVTSLKASVGDKQEANELAEADRLIRQEMIALIIHEAYEYPFEKNQIDDPRPEFTFYSGEQMALARSLISEELLRESRPLPSNEAIAQLWSECNGDTVYSSSHKRMVQLSDMDKKEQVQFYSEQLEALRKEMTEQNNRVKKLDSKLAVTQKGYQIRSNNLIQGIKNTFQDLVQAEVELDCFKKLHGAEVDEMNARVAYLTSEVASLEEREAQNQQQYQELMEKLAVSQ